MDRDAWRRAQREKVEQEGRCLYSIAQVGYCGLHPSSKNEVGQAYPFCNKHEGLRCMHRQCEEQAVGECGFAGVFVCGVRYCEAHSSQPCPRGHLA